MAWLEGFFDHDAHAHDLRAGQLDQFARALRGLAVGQEVVDEEYPVATLDELGLQGQLIVVALGEGEHAGLQNVLGQDAGSGFLHHDEGETHRHGGHRGGHDAGGFDRHHAGCPGILEQPGEFLTDLAHQFHVHLVVEEGVHEEDVLAERLAAFENPLLEKLQKYHLLSLCSSSHDTCFGP